MGILDEVKSIATTIQQIDNIELYRKILDLQAEILQLVEERNGLAATVKDLQAKIQLREELRFEYNVYWRGPELKSSDGPFCSRCWDVDGRLVRMHIQRNTKASRCPTCKESIYVPRAENEYELTPPKLDVARAGGQRIKMPRIG